MRKIIVSLIFALLLSAAFTDGVVTLIAAQKRAEMQAIQLPQVNFAYPINGNRSGKQKSSTSVSKYDSVETSEVALIMALLLPTTYIISIYLYEALRKYESADSGKKSLRGKFRSFLQKKASFIFFSTENGEPCDLLDRLEKLKKNPASAVPFGSETDVALGYSLLHAALSKDSLSAEQQEKFNVLGEQLNASQQRVFCFPGTNADVKSSLLQLLIAAAAVFLIYSLIRMSFKTGFTEAFSFAWSVWMVFQTPAYCVENIRKSWFFKLFFAALKFLNLATTEACEAFGNGVGNTITIWKDAYTKETLHVEEDRSGSFILWAAKMIIILVLFVFITKAVFPVLALIFIVRNHVLHK